MLKQIFFALALFISAYPSIAQTKTGERIKGNIITSDGYAAENITVSLKNTTYGSITDSKGRFSFEAPSGNYTMIIYSIIAHRKEFSVIIKAGEINNFPDIKIDEDKHLLREVIVTGQFSPQSLRNSLYKVRLISQKQIQQKAATNIQDLLKTEIGFRMSNDMALGETDVELMGMSGNNVKVLIDGVPLIDRSSTKQSLSQIDINTVEQIEIVDGPMSVIYGTDALAGVINIITKKGSLSEGEKRLSLSAKIQEESVGDEYNLATDKGSHTQSASGNYSLKNGFQVGANFTHNDFGGWQGDSTGRKKQWQPKEQYLLGGKLGYTKKNYDVWYRLDFLNENILTMQDVNSVTNLTSDKEFIVDRYTHQLQGNWALNNQLSFTAAGSYQTYHRRTRTTIINLSTGKKELSLESGAQDVAEYSAWFGRVAALWKPSSKLSFQPGVEYQLSQGEGDRIDKKHQINNTALFLSAEYLPFTWFTIRPGVRSSFNSAYDAPWAIPSLNLKFNLDAKTDLRLSYGRGFRAPTLQELYYSFHDSNHNIDGNPDLKSEYSNSYMASLTVRPIHTENIRLTSSLSAFYNDFRDKISLLASYTTDGYYTYYNIDKYKTQGLTVENSLKWKSLSVGLNLSYVGRYNSYSESEDYKDVNMSKFRYSPELSVNATYDWKKVATFSFFYKYTGKRHEYTLDDDELKLEGLSAFNWADFTVSRALYKYIDIQVGVKNIFDITTVRNTTASSGAHSTSNGVNQLGSGRSYFVGLAFNY